MSVPLILWWRPPKGAFYPSGVEWLLRDDYNDNRAAGYVSGTYATPGPGIRSSNSGTYTQAGDVYCASAQGIVLQPGISRTWGKFLVMDAMTSDNGNIKFGWNSGGGLGTLGESYAQLQPGSLTARDGVSNSVIMTSIASNTRYKLAFVLKPAGAYYFFKGGAYTDWRLGWIGVAASTASVFSAIYSHGGTGTSSFMRVPRDLYIVPVEAYDSFSRTGTFGNTESYGPDGQAITTHAWTGATWAVSSNKAVNTPTSLGSEDVTNGNMETGNPPTDWTSGGTAILTGVADERTGGGGAQSLNVKNAGGFYGYAHQTLDNPAGTWVKVTAWGKRQTLTDPHVHITTSAIVDMVKKYISSGTWLSATLTGVLLDTGSKVVLRNGTSTTGDEGRYDDVSVKPLTLSELIASVQGSTANVIASVDVGCDVGYQAGLILNLDSAASPANFILVYLNTSNGVTINQLRVDKYVAGVITNLAITAITYVSGAKLVVIKDGTSLSVYYNNALVGTTLTIDNAGIIDNTKHGLFSTSANNNLDNFTIHARGNEGQYSKLDRYIE